MKKRIASLVLLLVLAGGTFAGIPLRFGEGECSMGNMMEMDCCKAALMQSQTAEAAAAKLCCALNCAQNGTTSPPSAVRVASPAPTSLSPFPAIPQQVLITALRFRYIDGAHGPPGSPPAYLRHLALLI
jgi:hypothetical protein